MEQRITPKAHRFCIWAGAAMMLAYLLGFVIFAKLVPVPSPNWSAERLTAWLSDHKVAFQVGCVFMITGASLIGPWGAALAIWTRRTEERFPVLYATQIVSIGAGAAIFVLIEVFWAVAAFRVGEVSAELTQAMFDVSWFLFLFASPPFIVWIVALALGILWNPPEHQYFPRWAGYLTLVLALDLMLALMMVFFKTGPFSYSGLLALWLPFGSFFAWALVMIVLGLKAISRQEKLCGYVGTEGVEGVHTASESIDGDDHDTGSASLPARSHASTS